MDITKASKKKNDWILYKLGQRDDSRIWHELHKKNNALRNRGRTPARQYSTTFARNQGHTLNPLTASHRSEVGLNNVLGQDRKAWHNAGRNFSKLSRWSSTPSLFAKMTTREALQVDFSQDPDQDRSRYAKHCHAHGTEEHNTTPTKQAARRPSAVFESPERPQLFDLDNIEKQSRFDRVDTESLLFAQNSQHWLRDNVGFSIMARNHTRHSNKTATQSQSRQKLPRIPSSACLPKQKQQPKSDKTEHSSKPTSRPLGVKRRRMLGSKSLNKLYNELEFKSLSQILSGRRNGGAAANPASCALSTINSGGSSSAGTPAPLTRIKLPPRTPLNHKPCDKYRYTNMFKPHSTRKIFILGSNSVQGTSIS